MHRRRFLSCGLAGTIGTCQLISRSPSTANETLSRCAIIETDRFRKMFDRADREVFLNAAGGTPLSTFALDGARRFEEFWRFGPADGRGKSFQQTQARTRSRFAELIGAETSEIGLVSCTKAGEQIVIDGIPSIRRDGNIVTNDLHFTGSLHNLIGLKKSGVDVRIVKSSNWRTGLEEMKQAIDRNTSLVCISLVSNINGHIEPVKSLAENAHKCGAWLYADIIQATGIIPIARAM